MKAGEFYKPALIADSLLAATRNANAVIVKSLSLSHDLNAKRLSLRKRAIRMMDAPGPKRVVIVDDSATMRAILDRFLKQDPRLEVVGEAADAEEARSVIKATNPDVITLDIEMPKMNGLEFLRHLMRLRPMPVVMLSSLTSRHSEAAVHAFALGAVDCIWKPTNLDDIDADRICSCVYNAANARVGDWSVSPEPKEIPEDGGIRKPTSDQIILLGSSTGGVSALEAILTGFPGLTPPIVIAQHMPDNFLRSFSARLDGMLPHDVGMAQDGEALSHGVIRLAPSGGVQTAITFRGGQWSTKLEEAEGYEQFSPSVDHLFYSAVDEGTRVIATILTGIGHDGAKALRALRDAGARTFGQDESTCVVYGMPKAAWAAGGVETQARLEDLGDLILRETKALH